MRILVLTAPVMIGACAYGVDAPSLAPRAIERPAAERELPQPSAISPAVLARISVLTEQAQRGEVAFQAAIPKVRVNAPPQSDAWSIAQSAISAADLARAPTLDALAALDALVTATFSAQSDPTAVEAARAQVQTVVDRQNARLDALTTR